jgi:hypothetical protein
MAGSNQSAGAGGGAVYGIGLIGAAVYYFQQADEFWEFVLALPKAIIWPGILVYELLKSVYG